MAINNDQLKKFKEALADIIVSSQGLCTYDACKDVAEREATFLISMLLPEPNIQSSNIKETIRAEIERRIKFHYKEGIRANADRIDEDEIILAWLDSLPERPKLKPMNIPSGGGAMGTTPPSYKLEVKKQPVEGLDVTDFCKPIDPGIAQCVADHWWEMIGEESTNKKPVEGLEEEMEKFFETMPVLEHENIFEDTFQNIAHHFAEWGAEHLKK